MKKSLNQLKNRIAWEIRTLRDREGRIVKTRALRNALGLAGDELDAALRRRFARVPAAMRRMLIGDMDKDAAAIREVRAAIGV